MQDEFESGNNIPAWIKLALEKLEMKLIVAEIETETIDEHRSDINSAPESTTAAVDALRKHLLEI